MPSVETSIWLALRARIASLVLNPILPIAWPNESFTPPATGYLRVSHIPNVNRRLFHKGTDPHERLGLLQVDVFARQNQNAAVAVEIAGQIAAHFPADLRLPYGGIRCQVTKAPDIAQAMRDGTFWMVPVTISYRCFI